MKRIFRAEDESGGYLEVQILEHNNKTPEDLIWVHMKTDSEENGFCMTTGEAVLMAEGLLSAVNKLKTYTFPKQL